MKKQGLRLITFLMVLVMVLGGTVLAEETGGGKAPEDMTLFDYQYNNGTELVYADYSLSALLGGHFATVCFGDADLRQHTMGGVLVKGDLTAPGAGFADTAGGLPSYVKGMVKGGGAYSGRSPVAPPLYVSSQNTVTENYGTYTVNGAVTSDQHSPVYISDNFVDFDAMEAAVKTASNLLAMEPGISPEPYMSSGLWTIDVPIGSTVTVDYQDENGNPLYIGRINFIGDSTDKSQTLVNYPQTGTIRAPELMMNGSQMMGTEEHNSIGTSILFNLPNAEEFTWKMENGQSMAHPWVGHIVAPNADVDLHSGNYAGTVICKNFVTTGENHVFAYHGKEITTSKYAIPVQKFLRDNHGNTVNLDRTFTFRLAAKTEGAPMPEGDTVIRITDSGIGHFGTIEFTEDDVDKTYQYYVTEDNGSTGWGDTLNFDRGRFTVSIAVSKVGSQIVATPSFQYQKYNEPYPGYPYGGSYGNLENADTVAFSNTNNGDTVEISGTKKWVGDETDYRPGSNEVKLTLYRKAGANAEPEVVDVAPTWVKNGDEWTWKYEGLIKSYIVYSPGSWWPTYSDYIYYVVEETLEGYTVTYLNGDTEGTSASDGGIITNTFTGTTAQLGVTKELTGDVDTAASLNFYFKLEAKTEGAPMPKTGDVAMVTGSGDVVFGEIPYSKAGEYEYYLRETDSGIHGVTYDSNYYVVKVKVRWEEPKQQWKVEKEYTKFDSAGNELKKYPAPEAEKSNPVFTNDYIEPEAGYLTLEAGKILQNTSMKEGQFFFELYTVDGNGQEKVLQTVTNQADGSIKFDPIEFTANDVDKNITYYIREKAGDDWTIDYDKEKFIAQISVKVEESENQVVPSATYLDGEGKPLDEGKLPEFVNTYNEPTGTIALRKQDSQDYSAMAGVVFGVYEDEACTREVATLTTDDKGEATVTSKKLVPNTTYYVKEKTAPDGYQLNETVYSVTVKERFETSWVNNGNAVKINIKGDILV